MSIASISSAQSQQQVGPASAQPLSIETQYHRSRLEEDLQSLRQSYMAGDAVSVRGLAPQVLADIPGAGLDQAVSTRFAQDAKNPGPEVLAADNAYMRALNIDDSVMGPITKSTYSSADLAALNGGGDSGSDASSGNDFGGGFMGDSGAASPQPSSPQGVAPASPFANGPYGAASAPNPPSNAPSSAQGPASLNNLPPLTSATPGTY